VLVLVAVAVCLGSLARSRGLPPVRRVLAGAAFCCPVDPIVEPPPLAAPLRSTCPRVRRAAGVVPACHYYHYYYYHYH